MAFMRTDTAHTLKSRAWSTEDLSVGLAHILTDGRLELPDDLSQLKDHPFLGKASMLGVGWLLFPVYLDLSP